MRASPTSRRSIAAKTGGRSDRDLGAAAVAVVERLPCATHRPDRIRLPAAIDRLAQPTDMDVNSPLVDIDFRAPYAVKQLLAREHASGPFHQKFEQPVLGRAKFDLAAAAGYALLLAVEFDVSERQHVSDALRRGAAKQGPHPRNQLWNRERLDNVVVRAGRQATDAFALFTAGREHDDRERSGFRTRA